MGHQQVGSVSIPDDDAELSDVEIASCHSTHEDFYFDAELNPAVFSRCSGLAYIAVYVFVRHQCSWSPGWCRCMASFPELSSFLSL